MRRLELTEAEMVAVYRLITMRTISGEDEKALEAVRKKIEAQR